MNVSQFVAKWRRSELKERAGSQEHFIDLCGVFDHPTPADMDTVGDTFTFEREAAKSNGRKGRADVWKRDYFAWEYKSKHKDLDDAHDQLRQYREALLNPPLLAACDMAILDIRTNFTRRATRRYEVPLDDLGDTVNRRIVEHLFYDPNKLEPGQDVEAITDKAAGDLAAIAQRMRARGLDPTEVALFLDRVVFCLFAQDVRLLADHVFSKIVEKTHRDSRWISREIFNLFQAMNTGGECALEKIPYFNGDLFADVRPLELTNFEVEAIHKVARLNWGEVDASIFGTLFERGMDPDKEREIGTHYTRREDISALVEPVVMAPLKREWSQAKDKIEALLGQADGPPNPAKMRARSPQKDSARYRKARRMVHDFLQRLRDVTILDPACGSGNFLYVSLQKLKDLEKAVLVYASELNIDDFLPGVGPWQLRGIEKSLYAYDLARTTIWIGWLQWTKANGYKVNNEPILRALDNLKNADAILDLSDPEFPREPSWPDAEFIVGNPPFLGAKKLRTELGDEYVEKLFDMYGDRIPNFSDLCCYWFEKARTQVESGRTNRVGLLATQGIRGGLNSEVLKRVKRTGDIFFACSNRKWILNGANVGVSMIGFDAGQESGKVLDDQSVQAINPDLTSAADVTRSRRLAENRGVGFYADVKSGKFDLPFDEAVGILNDPSPNGKPASDVIRPWSNGRDVVQRPSDYWIIDFGVSMGLEAASLYEGAFRIVKDRVEPERRGVKRKKYRESWWLHAEPCGEMRRAISRLDRYIATTIVSKYRLFVWMSSCVLPDHALFVVARDDDYTFGVLHSRLHEVWSLRQGTFLENRPRYTPTTCFETFPFPDPFAGLEATIGEAARDLNAARERWLNPPEWTRTEVLDFPGSTSGPWSKLVHEPDDQGIGVVRYARRIPKDAECAKKLAKRTLTNLYNQRPTWLDLAHRKLDESVFAAYGWGVDLSDDEILARLLALNLGKAQAESEGSPAEPAHEQVVASFA